MKIRYAETKCNTGRFLHSRDTGCASQASYDKMRTFGAQSAVVIHGEGEADGSDCPSWNGGGSSGANAGGGQDGPICNNDKVTSSGSKCYSSCQKKGFCTTGGSPDKCRWSHCHDDVAFVLAMLNAVKARTTVDADRIFASGSSNGGMFMYELASDPRSAHVFSALAPDSGLPHNGFNRGTPNTNLRFLEFAGKTDNYVYPYPNVKSDPTESYGTQYGWYYSAWDNTTSLWAAQKGLTLSQRKTLNSASGLECQGWSTDGSATGALVATCFFSGGHCDGPSTQWSTIWSFFGLDSSPTPSPSPSPTPSPSPGPSPGGCPKTCSGYTCDEWYDYSGITCAYEEQNYGCDCSGCQCKGGLDADMVV